MFRTFHVYFLLCCNANAFVICALKNYLLTYIPSNEFFIRILSLSLKTIFSNDAITYDVWNDVSYK